VRKTNLPDNLPKNFPEFWDELNHYLKTHNKKLEIRDSSYLNCHGKCGGYCDGDKIVVAKRGGLFLETLTHEFCHLQQAVEESPLWAADLWNLKFDLLDFRSLYNLILLERDCELRVLELNKRFGFFGPSLYAQRANTYLFFYHYVFLKRKWRISTTIYKPELVSRMPTEIVDEDRLLVVDMGMMMEYERVLG